jgi:hypothetical protein
MKMRKRMTVFMVLAFRTMFGLDARATGTAAEVESAPKPVTITIVGAKVTEKALEIRYQIRNGSQQDIWICESVISGPLAGPDFEVCLSEGSGTLTVRKRLDIAGKERMEWPLPPFATYLRLPAGDRRSESITLPLPVHPVLIFGQSTRFDGRGYPTRLRVEIGFHDSDLSKTILAEPGKSAQACTMLYEAIRDRDRTAQLAVQGRSSEVEQVLSAVSDVSRIPCVGDELFSRRDWPEPSDMGACTRVKVECHPSMLAYCFPGAGEQSLFSRAEREYLQS